MEQELQRAGDGKARSNVSPLSERCLTRISGRKRDRAVVFKNTHEADGGLSHPRLVPATEPSCSDNLELTL